MGRKSAGLAGSTLMSSSFLRARIACSSSFRAAVVGLGHVIDIERGVAESEIDDHAAADEVEPHGAPQAAAERPQETPQAWAGDGLPHRCPQVGRLISVRNRPSSDQYVPQAS